ncbi:MAG TPA: ABC transporter permease subunit [Acidimicrobiales bacterium]|nr:ABC transporter permease subunit [Acidimicrobiales bacterium]
MAWRLQRNVYLFFVAVSAVLIAFTITNGLHAQSIRRQWQGIPCHGGNGFAAKYQPFCQALNSEYIRSINSGQYLHWMALLPMALLGLVLGANLVASEIDRNTVRTAWTQSITRNHWFAIKVAVGLTSLVLLAVPLCVTASWWINASKYTTRLQTNGFTYAGWMPLAVGIFAFAVATIIGTILRRPGWSVAAALVVVLTLMLAVRTDVRTTLVPLRSTTIEMTTLTKRGVTVHVPQKLAPENAWVVFNGLVPIHWSRGLPTWPQEAPWLHEANRCPLSSANTPNAYLTCLEKADLKNIVLYVADNEYWTLQLREGGLYLGAAALLFAANLALVRRARA